MSFISRELFPSSTQESANHILASAVKTTKSKVRELECNAMESDPHKVDSEISLTDAIKNLALSESVETRFEVFDGNNIKV